MEISKARIYLLMTKIQLIKQFQMMTLNINNQQKNIFPLLKSLRILTIIKLIDFPYNLNKTK